jgi:hypothetical protein
VVADGGHAALVDGQLDAERVLHRHDLRSGRPRREQPVGRGGTGDRHGAAASRSEGGEKERHEASAGHDHERRGAACSTGSGSCFLAFSLTGARGEAGGFGRSHPRHANRGHPSFQTEPSPSRGQELWRLDLQRLVDRLGLERERTRDRERPVLVDCPEVDDFPCFCRDFVFLVVEAIPERHC